MMGRGMCEGWAGMALCLVGAVSRISPPSLPLPLDLVDLEEWEVSSSIPAGTSLQGYHYPGQGEHRVVVGWRTMGQGYFGDGMLHFGRSQMQPHSLGRAASPHPHPILPFLSGLAILCRV